MEIKSIIEIKNVGIFSNFSGGGVCSFEKLTFIYGNNTYGKTTLTDIFQSLKKKHSDLITSRKTIPNIIEKQKVELKVKIDDKESKICFENNYWQQNTLSDNLEIFGTDFIHENVFTGFLIERDNQVNFTEFILGESGVKLAEQIGDNKKELKNKIKELKNKIPNFVKSKEKFEITKFIEFDISSLDKKKINDNLLEKKKEKEDEEKNLKEPKKILDLLNIIDYTFEKTQVLGYFEEMNNLLEKDYSNIKDEVLEKINTHIKNNFNKNDNAENWIKQGLSNCKDKENGSCVFCGQNLENAKELINAYDSYFNEEYNKFTINIESGFKLNIKNINDLVFSEQNKLQKILVMVSKFKNLIKDQKFQDNILILEEKIVKLEDGKLTESKKQFLDIFIISSDLKNKKPYQKIEKTDFKELSENIKKYEDELLKIKEALCIIKIIIEEFKNQYKDTKNIQEKISKLDKEVKDLEYQKARIDQNQDCENCKSGKIELGRLNKTIEEQEKQLQEDQSQYLDNYFDKINELFDKFGSHNFGLTREENNRGYKPVYSLKIEFHNKKISKGDLQTVFSESDRRALALAIFWAKIDLKSKVEKKQTIIILDDPITSFDKERSRNFITYLKEFYNKLSQILIFTHYEFFIKQYAEYTKSKPTVYQLNKKNISGKITSLIESFDIDFFLKSDYLKYYDNIYKFIEYKDSNFDETHLRIFFEDCYLPIFKEKINESKRRKYMSELSPSEHKVKFEDDEAIRNYAKEMMKDLYSFEFNDI